ncbi:MAG TPA: non-homologous end-joining DNA ligase [Candidatus Binatia bacterium]|jgi:bifunctional non-homologous end joining protein LigD
MPRTRAHRRLPATVELQLARLTKAPPAGDAWLHELKYDGYRILCRIEDGRARLVSRSGKDWTAHFPEVRDAALALPLRAALLDGEVAVVEKDGRTSFQSLQKAFSGEGRERLVYFVFDLLHLDGDDLSRLALEERKARLAALLASAPSARGPAAIVRFAAHVVGDGPAFYDEVCRVGVEGIVSKRRDLPYAAGRHGGWLKTKCLQRETVVIGGFTDPEGTRAGIGALVVGVRDGARLVCAGKVGTGFTQTVTLDLRRQLNRLETAACPFTPRPTWLGRGTHWVRPTLRAEVTFSEWTDDGRLRHPSFRGLSKAAAATVRPRSRDR